VGLSGAAAYLQQGLVRARTGYMLAPFTIVGGAIGSFLGLVLPAKTVATAGGLTNFMREDVKPASSRLPAT